MANLPTADEVDSGARAATPFTAKAATSAFFIGPHNTFTYNGLVLNNRRQRERYWLDELTGFDDPDVAADAEANTQEDGETPNPGFYRGRTMTMGGWIEAGSYTQAMVMGEALHNAFLNLVEQPLTIATIDDPASFFLMPDVEIWARKVDKLMISSKVEGSDLSGIFKRPFTLSMRATDPRYTTLDEQVTTIVPQVITQLGRGYDRGYDLGYTQLMDQAGNPSAVANVGNVTNLGNWPARALYHFDGPMAGITLTNNANGQMMRLDASIAAGEWIEVDARRGVIYDRLGNPAGSVFDPISDWVRVAPASGPYGVPGGVNQFSLGVSSYGPGAQVQIIRSHTYI